MAGTIKGIIVEIGGDTSGLQKALSKVNSQTTSLSKELRGVNSLLKLDPSNTELLSQKQEILNKSIETTQDKLNQLKKIKEEADKKMAEGTKISEENYRNLQREIINTERKLNNLTQDLKEFNLENTKWTKNSKKIEEYGDKITKVSKKVDDFGNKISVISAGVAAGGALLTNSAMNLENAVAKYVSSTNTATEETEKYKQVLEDIYNKNFGDSYEDIADSMAKVQMQLKDLDSADLENITEKAIALRDLFGYDVSESIRSVKALMDNFNISADEAFNLIAEGKKQGLDFSNELLDNINEYSVQFKKLGLDAEDMFNIFKVGTENGAFNLDKIGDAVKEFSIRVIDGSNTTIDGFKRIGLNADEMAEKFANGGEEAKKAFVEVVQRLENMDDKVSQSIAGVDLFGTMWEDLGPTVIMSFDEMDNGISKSSDSMQKSIDELYNTTKKKAETQLKRLKSLGADFGEEMLPTLEKLIDYAEGFVEKLEDMSDEEKENVLKIALLVAGMGPLVKIFGTAGTAIGSVTSGLGKFTQAIGVATGKTTSNVTSVNLLAKALNFLTSPTGIVIGLLGTAITTLTVLKQKTDDGNSAISESAKELENTKNKYNELIKAQQEAMNSKMSEIDNTEKLVNELRTLVDENGKVKDGYKDRVSFILNELNKALGTEYSMTGDVINNYKNLTDSIDKLIVKKRASILLDSEEEKYTKALNEKDNAYKTMIENENNLAKAKQNLADSQKQYNEMLEKGASLESLQALERIMDEQTKAVQQAQQNVNNSKDLYKNYLNDIATYENDYAIIQSDNTEKIQELLTSKTYAYQQNTEDVGEAINKSIQQVQNEMEYYKQARQEDLNNQDEINAQKNQAQIEAGKKQLETLTQQLVAMTSTTEELTPQQIEAWRNLANNSYEEYKNALEKMDDPLRHELETLTRIFISNKDLENEAGYLASRMVKTFEDNAKTEQAGINFVEGAYRGIKNSKAQTQLFSTIGTLGKNMLNVLNASLDEHSPSKLTEETGINFVKGPIIGIKKEKKNLLKEVNSLGNDMINSFNKINNIGYLNFSNLQGNLKPNAVQKMTTNSITNNFYVQKMDEANMQQCLNYINKKFGDLI